MMRGPSGVALGLALGCVLDVVAADPRRGHPIAVFGGACGRAEDWRGACARAEDWLWADSRRRGALFTALCAGPGPQAGQ